jgi:hypothetical protein
MAEGLELTKATAIAVLTRAYVVVYKFGRVEAKPKEIDAPPSGRNQSRCA